MWRVLAGGALGQLSMGSRRVDREPGARGAATMKALQGTSMRAGRGGAGRNLWEDCEEEPRPQQSSSPGIPTNPGAQEPKVKPSLLSVVNGA